MPAKNAKNKYNLGSAGSNLVDLPVPSGSLCQVRRVGPAGLMAAGLIDNLDVLGQLVQTEHVDRVAGKQSDQVEQMKALSGSAEGIRAAMTLMDKVTCYVVVQPNITMPPEDPKEVRDPACTYADSIDLEDKMFIFQFVMGGSNDLAEFREGLGKNLGDMAAQPAVQDPAELSPFA